MPKKHMTPAEEIRHIRVDLLGWTQVELGVYLKIRSGADSVGKWERGVSEPRLGVWQKLQELRTLAENGKAPDPPKFAAA